MRLFDVTLEPYQLLTPQSLWGVDTAVPDESGFGRARASLHAALGAVASQSANRLLQLTRVSPEPLPAEDLPVLEAVLREWLGHWHAALGLAPAWMRLNLNAVSASWLAPRLDCSHQEWAFVMAAVDASLQAELPAADSRLLARELAPLFLATGHLSYLQTFWRERPGADALHQAMQADRLAAPERSCWLAAAWESADPRLEPDACRRQAQAELAELRPRVERSWLDLWEDSWRRVERVAESRARWRAAESQVEATVEAAAGNLRQALDSFRSRRSLEADLRQLLALAVREASCGHRMTARAAVCEHYLAVFGPQAAGTVAAALQTCLRQHAGELFEAEREAWQAFEELPAAAERAMQAQPPASDPRVQQALESWVRQGAARARRHFKGEEELPLGERSPGPATDFLESLQPLARAQKLAGRLWDGSRTLAQEASRRLFEELPDYAQRSGPGALAKCATDTSLTLARTALALELEESERPEYLSHWWNLLVNAYVSTRPARLFDKMLDCLEATLERELDAPAAALVVELLAPLYHSAPGEPEQSFLPLTLRPRSLPPASLWMPPAAAWPDAPASWRELLTAQREPYARTGFLEAPALARWREATAGQGAAAAEFLATLRDRTPGTGPQALDELLWVDYLEAWREFHEMAVPVALGGVWAPPVTRWEALRWLGHHGGDAAWEKWLGPAAGRVREQQVLHDWLRDPEPLFAADPHEELQWRQWLSALSALAAWQAPGSLRQVLLEALEAGWPRSSQSDFGEQVTALHAHLDGEGLLTPELGELLKSWGTAGELAWCPTSWGVPRGLTEAPACFSQAWREARSLLERRLAVEAWTGQPAGPEWADPAGAGRLALSSWPALVEAAVRWEGRPVAHPGPAGPGLQRDFPASEHAALVGRSMAAFGWNGSLGADSALAWRARVASAESLEGGLAGARDEVWAGGGDVLEQLLRLDVLQSHLELVRQVRAGSALGGVLGRLTLTDEAGLTLLRHLAERLARRPRRDALLESALELLQAGDGDWPAFWAASERECQALLTPADQQEVRQWLRRLSHVSRRLEWPRRVHREASRALAALPPRAAELVSQLLALGPLECVPAEVRPALRADLAARHPADAAWLDRVGPALREWFVDLDLAPLEAELRAYAQVLTRPELDLEGAARRLQERLDLGLDANVLARLAHQAPRGQASANRWGLPRWLWLAEPEQQRQLAALSAEQRERLVVALTNVLPGVEALARDWLEGVAQLPALEKGWSAAQGLPAAEGGLVRRLALEGWSGAPSGDGSLEWLAYEVVPFQAPSAPRQIIRALRSLVDNFTRAGTLPAPMVQAAEGLRTLAEFRLSRPAVEGQGVLELLQVADDGLSSPRAGRKSWWERLTNSIGELVSG